MSFFALQKNIIRILEIFIRKGKEVYTNGQIEEKKRFNYRQSREKKKKFIRYREGAEMYSMGISKFQELAKESGAVYKVKQMCLVNTEILLFSN